MGIKMKHWLRFAGAAASLIMLTSCGALNLSDARDSFAVYVKPDGLWKAELEKQESPVQIDEDGKFRKPLISPDGGKVAYIKDSSMLVAPLTGRDRLIVEVTGDVVAYAWQNDDELVFSSQNGGVSVYSSKEKTARPLNGTVGIFDSIVCGDHDVIYANTHQIDGQSVVPGGIVKYNCKTEEQNTVVPAEAANDISVGWNPVVAAISDNKRFLYVWNKPSSETAAADGSTLGIYDTQSGTYQQPDGLGQILPYQEQLSSELGDGTNLAFVEGAGRGMNRNKALLVYHGATGNVERLTEDNVTVMTPSFDEDGRTIYYSAGASRDSLEEWEKQTRSIFRIDIRDGRMIQVSKSAEGFDFAPRSLQGDAAAFLRRIPGRESSLVVTDGKKERTVDSGLQMNQSFYGYYATAETIDYYIAE